MADNIHDLFKNLKAMAKNANDAAGPMRVDLAEVKKVKPLELDFGEFTASEEDEELLVVSEHIRILQEGKIKLKGGKLKLKFDTCSGSSTTRDFEIQEDSEVELKDPDKLKKGDCLICLQDNGGESWVVLDRVDVEDEE